MARKARIVVPGAPHHVTQRGNRRQRIFFSQEDYAYYLGRLVERSAKYAVAVLAFCLMPNHVHMVMVPETRQALAKLLKELHADYALRINRRMQWTGHLWQSRFYSSPLDSAYFVSAVRYVELNPVRAKLATSPFSYPWSSASHRTLASSSSILDLSHALNRLLPPSELWAQFLGIRHKDQFEVLRVNGQGNLPCGSADFISELEKATGAVLTKRPRGRPRKTPPR